MASVLKLIVIYCLGRRFGIKSELSLRPTDWKTVLKFRDIQRLKLCQNCLYQKSERLFQRRKTTDIHSNSDQSNNLLTRIYNEVMENTFFDGTIFLNSSNVISPVLSLIRSRKFLSMQFQSIVLKLQLLLGIVKAAM